MLLKYSKFWILYQIIVFFFFLLPIKKSLNQFDEAALRENIIEAFSPLEEMDHSHSCLFHEFDHYGRE